MKIKGKDVLQLTIAEALTFAASYAVSEALKQKRIDEPLAESLLDRMNFISRSLIAGKVISWDDKSFQFTAHDISEATIEEGDSLPTSDVLIINGETE